MILLTKASDIPLGKEAKNYRDYINLNLVKAPQVSLENQIYYIELYTWHQIYGIVYHWLFEIKSNELSVIKKTEIAKYVGKWLHPLE